MNTIILAIESSCDDTSASIIHNGKILSNVTANQEIHSLYGGVVPEVASRKHQENIIPVVDTALKKANLGTSDLDAIAFTKGPGLMGSLLVGVSFAKSLALSMDIPLIEVNHMQGHILAHFIENPIPKFPFLCLTVSGGHTQIVQVDDYLDMKILGQTIDDAAGEAFDKSGKLLNLGYPAGPIIDKLAKQGKPIFEFAKPNIPGLDFSFSGFKTSVLYFLQKQMKINPDFIKNNLNDICSSVQTSIVEILIKKMEQAILATKIQHIGIAGGVSANSQLRAAFDTLGKKNNCQTYIPKFEYCTDNAAMIAITAHYKFQKKLFASQEVAPITRMDVSVY